MTKLFSTPIDPKIMFRAFSDEAMRVLKFVGFIFGLGVAAVLSGYVGLPQKVAKLEPVTYFLACRIIMEDEGKDPAACRFFLREIDVNDLMPKGAK